MTLTSSVIAEGYTQLYNISSPQAQPPPDSTTVLLRYQPAKSYPLLVDVQESLYFGRNAPVAEYGEAFYETATYSFFVPYFDYATGQYAYQTQTNAQGQIVDPFGNLWTDTPILVKLVNIIRNQQLYGQACIIKEPNGKLLTCHIGNYVATYAPINNWTVTFQASQLDMSLYV